MKKFKLTFLALLSVCLIALPSCENDDSNVSIEGGSGNEGNENLELSYSNSEFVGEWRFVLTDGDSNISNVFLTLNSDYSATLKIENETTDYTWEYSNNKLTLSGAESITFGIESLWGAIMTLSQSDEIISCTKIENDKYTAIANSDIVGNWSHSVDTRYEDAEGNSANPTILATPSISPVTSYNFLECGYSGYYSYDTILCSEKWTTYGSYLLKGTSAFGVVSHSANELVLEYKSYFEDYYSERYVQISTITYTRISEVEFLLENTISPTDNEWYCATKTVTTEYADGTTDSAGSNLAPFEYYMTFNNDGTISFPNNDWDGTEWSYDTIGYFTMDGIDYVISLLGTYASGEYNIMTLMSITYDNDGNKVTTKYQFYSHEE